MKVSTTLTRSLELPTEAAWYGIETPTEQVVLGDAVLQGIHEDGSDAWHDQRAMGIGGSDVASILQVHGAFTSRYMLWLQKMGLVPQDRDDDNEFFYWGHKHEPNIAERFRESHPEFDLETRTGSWAHADREWHLANPDGFILKKGTREVIGLLEIKTSKTGWGWENGRVPEKYVAQVRWYLECFGLEWAYIVVLEAGCEYREYIIHRSPSKPVYGLWDGAQSYRVEYGGEAMIAAVTAFVGLLASAAPPPLDGAEDTYDHVRGKNPEIAKAEKFEVGEIGMQLVEAKKAREAAEEEERRLKSEVLAIMGTAQYAYVDDVKVARRQAFKSGISLVVANV